jgi:hypothetical protein
MSGAAQGHLGYVPPYVRFQAHPRQRGSGDREEPAGSCRY